MKRLPMLFLLLIIIGCATLPVQKEVAQEVIPDARNYTTEILKLVYGSPMMESFGSDREDVALTGLSLENDYMFMTAIVATQCIGNELVSMLFISYVSGNETFWAVDYGLDGVWDNSEISYDGGGLESFDDAIIRQVIDEGFMPLFLDLIENGRKHEVDFKFNDVMEL